MKVDLIVVKNDKKETCLKCGGILHVGTRVLHVDTRIEPSFKFRWEHKHCEIGKSIPIQK